MPDLFADLYREALRLHGAGRIAEAERLYGTILDSVPRHAGALHHLGLVRVSQRREGEALALIGQALAEDPGAATAHYNLGTILRTLGRDAEAVAPFERAIALRPDYLEAHANLGSSLLALHRPEAAVQCYERALAIRPDHAETLNNLGAACAALDWREAAVEHYRRALAAKPDYVEARVNLGKALRALNRHAEAIDEFAQALRLRPGNVEAMRSQGMARLILGDFTTGWWQWRFARMRDVTQPLWLGETPLAGRTILLHAEQGLGDTIHFARYIPLVAARGARIVLEVPEVLTTLLSALPGVASVHVPGAALPDFNCHCPLPSLPLAFATDLATIPGTVPYLAPPAAGPGIELPPGKMQVGVTWAGNPAHLNDRNRSIKLPRLAPLLELPEIGFIALQKELREGEAEALRQWPEVRPGAPAMADFAATAALVAALDLVITVDTSIAHLAGALGKEVWILLPFSPDWRWLLERSDSPWYPTARLFRQMAPGDWDGVIAGGRAALVESSRSGVRPLTMRSRR